MIYNQYKLCKCHKIVIKMQAKGASDTSKRVTIQDGVELTEEEAEAQAAEAAKKEDWRSPY